MTWWGRLLARLVGTPDAGAPRPEGTSPPQEGLAAARPGIPVAAIGDVPKPVAPYIPPAAISLLHHYESCADKRPDGMIWPYLDAAGIPTIGWGNTRYADGRRVTMADGPITQAEADALFAAVVAGFSQEVLALLPATVDDDAHAAFLSLAYNIGVPGFASSTALRQFRAGDRKAAASSLELWNKSGGRVLKGLQRRRRAEKLVLLGATADSAISAALKDIP